MFCTLNTAKDNNELWVKGTAGPDAPVLLRSLGERLTDGETNNSNGYLCQS